MVLLCLLWMGFIFYMSSNNGEISHRQSSEVVNLIMNAQGKLQNGESKITEKQEVNQSTNKAQAKNISRLDYLIRKNAHGFMYMILAFLVSGLLFIYDKKGKSAIKYILIICLLYATSDEFHQAFVPGRTSLASDVLVDFLGAIIGVVFFYLLYYKVYEQHKLSNGI